MSVLHGATQLLHPPEVYETSRSLWAVLGISFAVDGYVLGKTLHEVRRLKPAETPLLEHIQNIRGPFLAGCDLGRLCSLYRSAGRWRRDNDDPRDWQHFLG